MSKQALDFFFNTIPIEKIEKNCMPIYTTMEVPVELNLPIGEIQAMETKEFENYIEKVRVFFLDKYEKENIPLGGQNATLEKIIHNFKQLISLDINDPKVFYMEGKDKILKGYNNSGNSVNHWFPEMRDVTLTSGKNTVKYSIIGQLRDLPLYKKKAERILLKDSLKMYKKSDQLMFPTFANCIKVVTGAQPLTNIRVPVAKWIYQSTILTEDKDEYIVFDPSAGWAGRLIAFLASSSHPAMKGKRCVFICTDPNKVIFERYGMIVRFWKKYVDPGNKAKVYPICCGSEEFHKTEEFKRFKGRGNIVYTSPPYYNRERYSDDPEQSFRKFNTYEKWRDGFLKDTIQNAYDFLGEGGKFFWNVSNISVTKNITYPLENDSVKIAKSIGFQYVEAIKMLMRNFPGRDQTDEKIEAMVKKGFNFIKTQGRWVKFESIFHFIK